MFPSHGITQPHRRRKRKIRMIGLARNKINCLTLVFILCFARSLTPSASGWRIPANVTLFGPKRIWVSPKTFRSKRVTKATPPIPKRRTTSAVITQIRISDFIV